MFPNESSNLIPRGAFSGDTENPQTMNSHSTDQPALHAPIEAYGRKTPPPENQLGMGQRTGPITTESEIITIPERLSPIERLHQEAMTLAGDTMYLDKMDPDNSLEAMRKIEQSILADIPLQININQVSRRELALLIRNAGLTMYNYQTTINREEIIMKFEPKRRKIESTSLSETELDAIIENRWVVMTYQESSPLPLGLKQQLFIEKQKAFEEGKYRTTYSDNPQAILGLYLQMGLEVTRIDKTPTGDYEFEISLREDERESMERLRNHETNVIYAEDIRIVPDTHGLDPEFLGLGRVSDSGQVEFAIPEGQRVVSIGDIIDSPKNLSRVNIDIEQHYNRIRNDERAEMAKRGFKRNPYIDYYADMPESEFQSFVQRQKEKYAKKNEASTQVDIRKSILFWTAALEQGKADLVLGNHDMLALAGYLGDDTALTTWLYRGNKGTETLQAFNINIPPTEIGGGTIELPDGFTRTTDYCKTVRTKISESPELQRFFDTLRLKGHIHTIVDEQLLVHAGIPVDKNRQLIPMTHSNGKAWGGFEGLVGLDALDEAERRLRAGDPYIISNLATSNKYTNPLWVRDPFFEAMKDLEASKKIIRKLDVQAKERGTSVQSILFGHSEAVGGQQLGAFAFGIDTAIGDIVELKANLETGIATIDARHHFGGDRAFGYNLYSPKKQKNTPLLVDHPESNEPPPDPYANLIDNTPPPPDPYAHLVDIADKEEPPPDPYAHLVNITDKEEPPPDPYANFI